MKPTRKEYEDYLNDLTPDDLNLSSRTPERITKPGTWMRRNDPIAFEVGFREYGERA